jgi:signal transduction histidine kinase
MSWRITFERLPVLVRFGCALGLFAALFAADYLTGWTLTLRVVYVAPVALAAWTVGAWAGVVMTVLAVIANFYFDTLAAGFATHRVLLVSDAMMRFCIYLAATMLLGRLRAAYRAAQTATQARDDVLGIVAHDLRNPVSNIMLASSVLRTATAPRADPRLRLSVDAIERAATRMNRLIQDLLDVTRMEAGSLSVSLTRVRTEPIVTRSVETQRALASAASVELLLETSRDLPDVNADADRLLQVFENLIGNALKFTKQGQITVRGELRGGDVIFSVSDTGIGIAADDMPHIFDRFWQARKAERRGAGLGLPIVKGIIEAHQGRIWVESTPGEGTHVFFTIPTAPSAAVSRPEQTSAVHT